MNTIRQILQLRGYYFWSIRPDQTVFEALRLMADKDVSALAVMEGDQLVGMLSETDYARKVILLGKASRDTPVSEIMTCEVFTIHPDQTVEEAMALMTSKCIRHLPVVEGGKVLGVVSLTDMARNIIHRQRETIKFLEDMNQEG